MPALNTLTDTAIRAALKQAAAAAKPVKKSDGGGLVFLAQPNGKGWWRLRTYTGGREGMLSLGTYPEVPLKAARAKRDAQREQHAAGVDLSAVRKAERKGQAEEREIARLRAEGKPLPGTFEFVARDWFTNKHEPETVASHAKRNRARLERHIFPTLGREPIASIEAPALLAVLRQLAEAGKLETAHRVRTICAQVFRHGIATGQCTRLLVMARPACPASTHQAPGF
jgi:hypothetical protein